MTDKERNLVLKDVVTDTEKPEEKEAVVVFLPDGGLNDWQVGNDEDGEEITVADTEGNQGYDADGNVVVVAWREQLESKINWKNVSATRLFDTCCSAGVPFYGFPEERLERV